MGEYKFDSKKHILEWRLPVIDASNSNGSMEFNIAGMESDFFPIRVEFISTKTYSHIEVRMQVSFTTPYMARRHLHRECNYTFACTDGIIRQGITLIYLVLLGTNCPCHYQS